jgi:hypothetical protein
VALDSLFLQTAEERFANRVVPALSPATHAGHKLVVLAPTIKVITAKLAALVSERCAFLHTTRHLHANRNARRDCRRRSGCRQRSTLSSAVEIGRPECVLTLVFSFTRNSHCVESAAPDTCCAIEIGFYARP